MAKKAGARGNGEGNVRRRADGKWEARIMLDGRSKSLYGRTRQDVSVKLAAVIQDHDKGLSPVRDTNLTVGRFLADWLAIKKGTMRSPRAWEAYETIVRLHLLPSLGKIKLMHLSPAHVQRLYSEKAESLSPMTMRHVHAALHAALEHGIRQGLLYRNVTELAERPRVRKHEMSVWTQDEARQFLKTAERDRYYAMYCLALVTTMRQGELFALRWRDVDLHGGTVTVRAAVRRSRTRGMEIAEPKTDSSRRTIAIDSAVVEILTAHQERQVEERTALGDVWRDLDLLFTDALGGPLRRYNMERRHYYPLLAKAGVPRIRFHDLRHTAATLLISRGVPINVVSHMLGHSSAALTLGVYVHNLPAMGRDAATIMGRTLWK
jgi:integrase